jgi:radical SAM protein with 4Fe4S-binding SPASM domain
LNESFISDFVLRTLKPDYKRRSLSAEKWMSLLDILPPSLEKVILSGGEPTLHPEFESIVSGLEVRCFDYAIFTNGRWPNPGHLITILRASTHFSGFLVSLHGVDAASHEAFTGISGSYHETLDNIQKARTAGLPIGLSTVITQQNLNSLREFPQLALELGAREISFNRFLYTPHRHLKYAGHIRPTTVPQLRDAIRQIEELRKKYMNRLRIGYGPTIPQCFEPSSSRMCSAGETSLVIDPWGNIKPCLHTDLLCGNLLQQRFLSVWESKNLQMWREMANNGGSSDQSPGQCGGGCRAMALAGGKHKDPLTLY